MVLMDMLKPITMIRITAGMEDLKLQVFSL